MRLPVSEVRRSVSIGAASLIALCLHACTAARPVPTPGIGSAPTPHELQAKLQERHTALASFQGQGRLTYDGPDGKLRSASMVVVKAPDKVRIDFRSPFSLTYTVVSDATALIAYDRGEKVLYRGRPSPENFGRYTHVAVDLPMLASLVRGLPPIPSVVANGDVGRVPEGWRWESPSSSGGRLAIVFDATDLRPLSARLTGSRGADFAAYFEDYEAVAGVATPHVIRAELPSGGKVELTYGTIWRDRTHADAAFHLDPPAGVRVVEMDAS